MSATEMLADIQKRIELNQLKSTEAYVLELIADSDDEQEREMLMAKYRRTQARRRELLGAA
jgi:hypothetical protein